MFAVVGCIFDMHAKLDILDGETLGGKSFPPNRTIPSAVIKEKYVTLPETSVNYIQ